MLKKILLAVLVIVVGFLGFVATRPAKFHIERSASIAAPTEVVFAKINDFHQWPEWSPWEKLDPNMKRTLEGDSGPGASYHWVGNDKVGEGRMTITESQPTEKVAIKLEFLKPWQVTNICTFALTPAGDATQVTWAMDGNNDFMSKAMGVFMNMDKMIGTDFEKGLGTLRTVAEAEAAKPAEAAMGEGTAAPAEGQANAKQ